MAAEKEVDLQRKEEKTGFLDGRNLPCLQPSAKTSFGEWLSKGETAAVFPQAPGPLRGLGDFHPMPLADPF